MPRRSTRRSRSDDLAGSLGLLLLVVGFSIARGAEALPVPWRIAVGLLLLSAALLVVWAIAAYVRRRRERALLEAELQDLSGEQFEQRVQLLLAQLGWTGLQRRGGRGDRGVDLVGQFQGKRYIVQCKRYKGKVAPSHVRDLAGAMLIQKAERALLVTTSGFTAQGYEEARGSGVELWDGSALAAQIERAAARRADPARARAARQRTALMLSAVVAVNLGAVIFALVATQPRIAASALSARDEAAPVAVATLGVAQPSTAPSAVPASEAASDTASELTPLPSAAVVLTGSLHAAPDGFSAVISAVAPGEQASLLGRSADGAWLQVIDARGETGWAQRATLQLDAAVEEALPIVAP